MHQRQRDALEVDRGGQRWTELTELTELTEQTELETNTKCWWQSKQSELITDR
jgi:hypothetical protein